MISSRFVKDGGFKEKMYRARMAQRQGKCDDR